jgi:hypothetical protein
MEVSFVHSLVLKAAPFFACAGLPSIHPDISEDHVKFDVLAQCWGGMASILTVTVPSADAGSHVHFVIKCVRRVNAEAAEPTSIGDARKIRSYRAEASFYQNGLVQILLQNGCCVPRPLIVLADDPNANFCVICMTRLSGKVASSMGHQQSRAALVWLARLHAVFWGKIRADSAVQNGLQEQGGYWYLDTRQMELA